MTEPVHNLPAWPPTRAEMRDYLARLREQERARGTWMKRANAELAARLERTGVRTAHTAYVEPDQQWTPPPIPEPIEPPRFTGQRSNDGTVRLGGVAID